MGDERKNQWHPAFFGALHLEFAENKQEQAKELLVMTNSLIEQDDKNHADSVWEIVTTQNKELIRRMGGDKEMCKATA